MHLIVAPLFAPLISEYLSGAATISQGYNMLLDLSAPLSS